MRAKPIGAALLASLVVAVAMLATTASAGAATGANSGLLEAGDRRRLRRRRPGPGFDGLTGLGSPNGVGAF
jgi:hypothetical protein